MAQEGVEPSASLVLSESGLPVAYRAGEDLNPGTSTQGGIRTHRRPGLSRAARPLAYLGDVEAEAVGLEPTSGPRPPPVFKTGPSSGRMASVRASTEFRGLESNQRPPRSERGVTTTSNCPGVREGGFEPPPPDSKSGSLPVSRFPRAPCGSRTRLSDLGSPRLTARPGTHQRSLRVRDRGVEPRSPGWKPGVVPLDQSRGLIRRKERESNPQGSSLARFRAGCRRPSACPSVIVKLRRQESNLRPPG